MFGTLTTLGRSAQAGCVHASRDEVRIGFITDLSGPYAALDGPAGAEAIRMAVQDVGGTIAGRRIEVFAADHRNNRDIAASEARRLFEDFGIDVLIGGVNSSTSLAIVPIATEKKKPFLVVGAGNTAHTKEQCSPYTVQYAYDTTAQGRVTVHGMPTAMGRTWYFLTPDYEFAAQMQDAARAAIDETNGVLLGAARHPYGAGDFLPFLRQAAASGAHVVGITGGHTDAIHAIRAAKSLDGLKTTTIAATFVFLDEIHALGPDVAQGLYVADSWFWNRDADTRAWSRRFFEEFNRMPSSLHAADYSAALQYLKAVEVIGNVGGDAVLAHMRKTPIHDIFAKNGTIRDNGLMIHDMYLLRVKSPAAMAEPWDYYDLVHVVSGDKAW